MNKAQFIEAMTALLAKQGEAERAQLIAYYTEMIDDRVESGLSEEDAVAALGDPEALVQEFLPPLDEDEGVAPRTAPGAPESSDADARYVDALREVRIMLKASDAEIRREPLANGAAAQVRFSDPTAFEHTLENGVLTITELPRQARGLRLNILGLSLGAQQERVTLTLADVTPERVICESRAGDLRVSDAQVGELLSLSSGSGDIEALRCRCAGRVEISDRSGDVTLEDAECRGECKLESISGDLELRRLRASALRVRTTSGDVELDSTTCEVLDMNAVSGDLELREVEAADALSCATISGDIDIARPAARRIRLNCVSGDITGRLPNLPGGYEIRANTRSGSIRLPEQWTTPEGSGAQAVFEASTVSGDIHVSIAE